MSKKIDDVTGQIKSVGDNEKFKKLIEILRSDPDLYGEFMSSPVELDTTSLYAIENYGSAMTPFYTVLAICKSIVLVAIMKVKVDEDEKLKNIKPNQAYFGRYIIFFSCWDRYRLWLSVWEIYSFWRYSVKALCCLCCLEQSAVLSSQVWYIPW